ncbi:MAG TPA: hypothetical protein PLV68_20855, partial [Ilumatobacteraceae bacterium]|nr:hypothetical protein [Ilumatobacteraceae bacterium]
NSKLELPAEQAPPDGRTFEEGKTKCVVDGQEKPASIKAWVWDNYSQVGVSDPSVYTADIGGIRIRNDGMVVV